MSPVQSDNEETTTTPEVTTRSLIEFLDEKGKKIGETTAATTGMAPMAVAKAVWEEYLVTDADDIKEAGLPLPYKVYFVKVYFLEPSNIVSIPFKVGQLARPPA